MGTAVGAGLLSVSAPVLGQGNPANSAAGIEFASASQAADAIRRRRISSRELTQLMLDRIDRFNPELNAIVNVLHDQALEDAGQADETQSRGDDLGPLHGVPIVIKDQFEIAGVPVTAGIEQLAQYHPASDSEVVRRLREAGAIILGNTNVPLLLNDWQSYNTLYGTTNNPWDATRTPGGSSGGSAAALAAGLAYFSPGSDRTGSLRLPAHFCGVYGHKPSLDVVPLRGWFPSPPGSPPQVPETIAVAGPMARSAEDLELGMRIMGGPEGVEAAAYSWSMPPPRQGRLRDYRVGFVLDDPSCPVDAPVRDAMARAIEELGRAGVELREGWPPGIDPEEQHRTYQYLLMSTITVLPPGLTEEQLRPTTDIDFGSTASIFAHAYFDPHRVYLDYARQQLVARRSWLAAFEQLDVFLMPTTFVSAFPHDQSEPQDARRIVTQAEPRPYLDLIFWNGFANLAGLPSTAAPIGLSADELPVGIQIVGPYLEDATPIHFAMQMAEELGSFTAPAGFAELP